MRFFKVLITLTLLACALTLAESAAVGELEQRNIAAESLLSVESGSEHSNEGLRQTRQFYGYYGRPYYNYYGGYGGYGGYYRPYYGGYGYSRPYYGNYGSYWNPYYGGIYG